MPKLKTPKAIAAREWKLVEAIIRAEYNYSNNQLDIDEYLKRMEFHYKTAFTIGWERCEEVLNGNS